MRQTGQRIAVLLHNVRSTHNVGSIFRTSEAAGVEKIYLSGVTPTPEDRFGRVQKDIAKTALGAERMLPWEKTSSTSKVIRKLKGEGWEIVGVEQDTRAIDYRKFSAGGGSSSGGRASKPTLIIFGNEVKGIPKSVRDACDTLIEIPMNGKKESLNVSVAAGIILFAFPKT
ncbi:MAG: TrmH family RNA methyltransferase [bacterium]|nr:TrmH family RNA methyltransferase [bacterium]